MTSEKKRRSRKLIWTGSLREFFFPTRFRKQLWTNVAVKQLMMMMVVVGDTDAKQHGGALDLKLRLELVVEKQLQLINVTHNCEAFFNFTSIIKVALATGPSKKGRMIWNFVVAKIKKISSILIKFWKLWPQTSVFFEGSRKTGFIFCLMNIARSFNQINIGNILATGSWTNFASRWLLCPDVTLRSFRYHYCYLISSLFLQV